MYHHFYFYFWAQIVQPFSRQFRDWKFEFEIKTFLISQTMSGKFGHWFIGFVSHNHNLLGSSLPAPNGPHTPRFGSLRYRDHGKYFLKVYDQFTKRFKSNYPKSIVLKIRKTHNQTQTAMNH